MAHITIKLADAQTCIEQAVSIAADEKSVSKPIVSDWIQKVEAFSSHCEKVKYRSHIAVLGNALLAKAANPLVDVFSLKASADDPGAYDARRTAENVLVPAAQRYKFHLGVVGPQPLNNLTFLRHHRIEARMTVRENARPLLGELIGLLHEIRNMRTEEAIEALAAFIIVRRRFVPKYAPPPRRLSVDTERSLVEAISRFVAASSERGGRAMACAAGLMDATFGEARVHLGKVHDPDRKVPGDIALRSSEDPNKFERVLEVRDKPVYRHTIHPPVLKAAKADIYKVTVLAVNAGQDSINREECLADAKSVGVDLTIFLGWTSFIASLTEWAQKREHEWTECAALRIRSRLVELALAAITLTTWDEVTALRTGSNA